MVRTLVLLMLAATSCSVWAEGRCPPGQFPVGGQGMLGCAPIPGANGGTAAFAPRHGAVPNCILSMQHVGVQEVLTPDQGVGLKDIVRCLRLSA